MTVNLIRSEPKPTVVPGLATALWLLVVDAVVSDSRLTTNNIFVNQKSPDPAVIGDRWAAVCSASQLLDLPVDKSKSGTSAFYRGSKAVFLLRTVSEMEHTWVQLLNDVALLVRDWSKLDAGFHSQTVTITPDSVIGAEVARAAKDPYATSVRYTQDASAIVVYGTDGLPKGRVLVQAPTDLAEANLNSLTDHTGVILRFNADKSRLLVYDSSGEVVAQAMLSDPP